MRYEDMHDVPAMAALLDEGVCMAMAVARIGLKCPAR